MRVIKSRALSAKSSKSRINEFVLGSERLATRSRMFVSTKHEGIAI